MPRLLYGNYDSRITEQIVDDSMTRQLVSGQMIHPYFLSPAPLQQAARSLLYGYTGRAEDPEPADLRIVQHPAGHRHPGDGTCHVIVDNRLKSNQHGTVMQDDQSDGTVIRFRKKIQLLPDISKQADDFRRHRCYSLLTVIIQAAIDETPALVGQCH
ncbi:hypothetical protein D3C75_842110 [compost metagenome]